MTICTEPFEAMARLQSASLGAADLPLVIVEHPLASLTEAEVEALADGALDRAVEALTG